MIIKKSYHKKILLYGRDILSSENMQKEKTFMQHGDQSVFHHSVAVAFMCLMIVEVFRLSVDERALVRGALLHDYFLYDWHVSGEGHRLHGFTHPKMALKNAQRDFNLGSIEKNMIRTHMFPLTPMPPTCRESTILCFADKLCATNETLTRFALWRALAHTLQGQKKV